jgi:hypothetical protein
MYKEKKRFCFGNNELLKYISVYISHTSHVQSLWVKDFRAGHITVNSMYIQQLLHNTSNSLWNVHRSTAKTEPKNPKNTVLHTIMFCLFGFWYPFPVSQLQWRFLFICYLPFDQILGLCYARHSLPLILIIDIIQLCPEFTISFTLFHW